MCLIGNGCVERADGGADGRCDCGAERGIFSPESGGELICVVRTVVEPFGPPLAEEITFEVTLEGDGFNIPGCS